MEIVVTAQLLDWDRNEYKKDFILCKVDRKIFDYPYRWMFSFVLTPMKLTWEI